VDLSDDAILDGHAWFRGRRNHALAGRERAEALLRFLGLWERRDDYVKHFSGGTRTRRTRNLIKLVPRREDAQYGNTLL
jgi:ABC-type multidrug transport system ATPase subunit